MVDKILSVYCYKALCALSCDPTLLYTVHANVTIGNYLIYNTLIYVVLSFVEQQNKVNKNSNNRERLFSNPSIHFA